MRINFTVLPVEKSLWTAKYFTDVCSVLQELGHIIQPVSIAPLIGEESSESFDPPYCDLWFVDASMDLVLPDLITLAKARGEKIVGHAHIGPEVPRIIYPWRYEAIERTRLVIGELDALYFHNQRHLELFEELYKFSHLPKMVVTGFPLDLSRYTSHPGGGSILFPHRFTYMKQPMLAALMLEDWKKETIFCTGWKADYTVEQKYHHDLLVQGGYRVLTEVSGIMYLKLLEQASVVVCTSVAETGCISCVEAVLSGAKPVVPDLPEFDWYPNEYKYPLYDVESFRKVVKENLEVPHSFPAMETLKAKHDHRRVVRRMMDAL